VTIERGLDEFPWLIEARNLIGLREIKGVTHEPKILALWGDAHLGHITDDETAWCAAFVGGTLERAGVRSTRAPNARSYTSWGRDVKQGGILSVPLGSILVLDRPPHAWMGHVTYAVGYNEQGKVLCLGGNQKDSVSIVPFETGRVIAARLPAEVDGDLRMLRTIPLLKISGPTSVNEA
jgi:uncharacterized protein (TIGR02594 family)